MSRARRGNAVKRPAGWKATLFVCLVLLVMYLPILSMVVFSFNAGKFAQWEGFSLHWYREMAGDRNLIQSLLNSALLAVVSTLGAAVLGTVGAVGMAKSHFRTKSALESVSTLSVMMPEIVLGMAYMAFFALIGLRFGFLTLLIGHITFCVPYIYINVKSRLAGLDKSIMEAGMDLGASPTRVFFDITLPLIMPAVFSGALLAFAMSMDDVVISFFTTGATFNTFPVKVYSMLKVGVTPQVNALCTILLGAVAIIVATFRLVSARKRSAQG